MKGKIFLHSQREDWNEVRKMTLQDIDDVAELEKLCFSSPWTKQILTETLTSGFDTGFLLLQEEQIVAYGILRLLAGEGEVQRIGVLPSHRRQGLGCKVMEAMTDYTREKQGEILLLEVREGNVAARNLYKSLGFEEDGRRKNYYTDPKEDGILMSLPFI